MESAHIDLHRKTLKLVGTEISRTTLLCFVWLVLCLVVNYNIRFSGLTNTWLKSDPHILNMVGGTVNTADLHQNFVRYSPSLYSSMISATGYNESIFA